MSSDPRDVRRMSFNRDAIEKSRLKERTGAYFRYEDPKEIVKVDPASSMALPPRQSFINTDDVARLEYLDRQYKNAVKDEGVERRRSTAVVKDAERWSLTHQKQLDEEARIDHLRESSFKGKKNHPGHPFNIVTLEYHDNRDGARLSYFDDIQEYKGELRKSFLSVQNHLGFNPITGEQTIPIVIPQKPDRPPLDNPSADFTRWTKKRSSL